MNNKVIVALDFADRKPALQLCQQLDPKHCRVKIGKTLFTKEGPAIVEKIVDCGFEVFLDLKYHDIPNTVMQACAAAAQLGVWMITVHAAGGRAMLEAATTAVAKSSYPPKLIAVTVLTSISKATLQETGITSSLTQQTLLLAKLAQSSGLDGVVCAAQHAALLRAELGKEFCLVTPGIRLTDSSRDDQQQVMTPTRAIAEGSDYLVIGRPIIAAADPLAVLKTINTEIFSCD